MKSVGDCSTLTDVGDLAMQISNLDLFGRIETAEELGAELDKKLRNGTCILYFLQALSSFEGTNSQFNIVW